MRKLTLPLLALIALLVVTISYVSWPRISNKLPSEYSQLDKQNARALIQEGKTKAALKIIRKYKNVMDSGSSEGNAWLSLLIDASEASSDANQLALIYEYSPRAFDEREKASLYIGGFFVQNGQKDKYTQLRETWRNREKHPEMWFVLDSDKMLLDGYHVEAIDFLKSRTFEGKADVGRLVRLGLLNVAADPQTSWKYFSEAAERDPNNADLHVYKAKLLEAANKPALALQEYNKAFQIDAKSPQLRDQLAEFFMRNNQISKAMEIWTESLAAPSTDEIWFKALFWNKVLSPIQFDWVKHTPPEGPLKTFVEYLISLKPGQFWDKASFAEVSNGQKYLNTLPATFWLRLLSALKNTQEKEAFQLVEYNPFQNDSIYPELELEVARTIMYRQRGTFKLGGLEEAMLSNVEKKKSPVRQTPEFFALLNQIADRPLKLGEAPQVPQDVDILLKSNDAFAAIFLAAGWMEAALQLNTSTVIPDSYPEWYVRDLAQALRINRGNEMAMEFLTKQKSTPTIELLIGEMMIAEKNLDGALEQLAPLVKDSSKEGYRAALLTSLIYLDKKEYDKAREIINSQPRFRNDTLGQETLARIALLEGKETVALHIYTGIQSSSPEARSYLARKAYEAQDWPRAKELTKQLLVDYPNNPTIKANMQSILEQEKQGQNQNPNQKQTR